MGAEARQLFAKYIADGDIKAYTDKLKDHIETKFTETLQLLRNKDVQDYKAQLIDAVERWFPRLYPTA